MISLGVRIATFNSRMNVEKLMEFWYGVYDTFKFICLYKSLFSSYCVVIIRYFVFWIVDRFVFYIFMITNM